MRLTRSAKVRYLILVMSFVFVACVPMTGSRSGIEDFTILDRAVVYEGKTFGDVGAYELVLAKATGVLDPDDHQNAGIVNLDKAPKNNDGLVEYAVDVQILKPVDMSLGNGILLYDVVNRGSKMALSTLNGQTDWTASGAGNGFLQNRGYTVVWSGWQGDVPMTDAVSADSGLGTDFPVAVNEDGSDIVGYSREEFVDKYTPGSFVAGLTYPAASGDKSEATLTVRENETDPRVPVAQENWDYVPGSGNQQISVTKVPGFDNGAIYEFIYLAKSPKVMGIGFAAIRDVMSYLRNAHDGVNPLEADRGHAVKKAIVFGVSQSGRAIRDLIYQGFNLDIRHHVVFEGAMPVIAGARRTYVNYEFGQPGRFTRQHEDHLYPQDAFPFTYGVLKDKLTGEVDGIFKECGMTHSCPKLFHIDTDTEVWQGHNSLIVTDTKGRSVKLPKNVRTFLLTGMSHAPSYTIPWTVQRNNHLSYSSALRALLVSMKGWVADCKRPVQSKWPSVADGSYVSFETAAMQWPEAIPGWVWLDKINTFEVTDYSVQPPEPTGRTYPQYVPSFDADGNPMGGLMLPDISVPVGTYSGRSTRGPGFAPGELNSIFGAYRQFELTVEDRELSGDPRLSLAERYPGADSDAQNASYQEALMQAAEALVASGYMLPEDASAYAGKTLPTTVPAP